MTPSFQYWRFCLWGGPIFCLSLLVFWLFAAHIIPPLSATVTPAEVAVFYRVHANGIRLGMGGTMTVAPFYLMWGLGITKIMETLEGDNRVLSVLQLWGAGLNALLFIFMACVLLFGAYRPDAYSPELLIFDYDAFWIAALVDFCAGALSQICIGVLFLQDRRSKPLFPPWVCWYSLWAGAMAFLELGLPFFKWGIFARDGVLNFWVELNVFFGWLVITTIYSFKAVSRLEQETVALIAK